MPFPANELEDRLQQASEAKLAMAEFVASLLDAELWIPVTIENDGEPHLHAVDIGACRYVRLFTSQEQASAVLPNKELVTAPLRAISNKIPSDWGIVLNPNGPGGFTISAATLQSLVADGQVVAVQAQD